MATPPIRKGERYGRWVILALDPTRPPSHRSWICHCDCGTERSVRESTLRNGISKSCGCSKSNAYYNSTRNPNDIDQDTIAYCAGLFDGEGTIGIVRRHSVYTGEQSASTIVSSHISVTYKPVITFLHKTFNVGQVIKIKENNRNCRVIWRWQMATYDTIFILKLLLPHLHVKYEEAMLAIKFIEFNNSIVYTKNSNAEEVITRREDIYRRLQSLKHIEWVE